MDGHCTVLATDLSARRTLQPLKVSVATHAPGLLRWTTWKKPSTSCSTGLFSYDCLVPARGAIMAVMGKTLKEPSRVITPCVWSSWNLCVWSISILDVPSGKKCRPTSLDVVFLRQVEDEYGVPTFNLRGGMLAPVGKGKTARTLRAEKNFESYSTI